jgi:hypothetical protein
MSRAAYKLSSQHYSTATLIVEPSNQQGRCLQFAQSVAQPQQTKPSIRPREKTYSLK